MPQPTLDRRQFLATSSAAAAALALGPRVRAGGAGAPGDRSRISLAGWSLHRRHFDQQAMPLIDFPQVAREEFDLGAIELVNTMFPAPTWGFLQDLSRKAGRHRVRILLIMCDREGDLSQADEAGRRQAVRNHHKWVDVAAGLGCHSIRVNTGGRAGDEGDIQRCADSLSRLAEYGAPQGIRVLVENHGGLSSHPESLVAVMRRCDSEWVGTLPDFGNFPADTDRYAAVAAMMPFARAVSAKCYDFDDQGNETRIDFPRMLRIVAEAGYEGHIGIEYEGSRLSEHDGILAARDLLARLLAQG